MKLLLPLLFIATISIFGTCSKNDDLLTRINCVGLVTDTLGTGDNGRIYMPNAFSPNGDGLNDIARPLMQNIASFTFTVYDENNRVAFSTTQAGQGWDGTLYTSTPKHYYKIQGITTGNRKIGLCGEIYRLTCFPASIPRSNFYFEDQLTPFGFTGVTNEALSNCP